VSGMPAVRILPTVPSMPTLGAVIARNVRAERARLGMDQAQLAERLGASRTTVSNLESGQRKVTADDLAPLCRALGVTLSQLIDRAEPEDLQALGI
jgi:transcriptional regulator with XRE-family HTH domain